MWFSRTRLIRRAEKILAAGETIPLDLYAALLAEGVDVTELERTIRNGQ